jgi:hypothetical protein
MNQSELKHLLQRVKDAPEFGGGVDASYAEKSWARLSAELGFDVQSTQRSYGFREYADYVWHLLGQHVMRPVSIGLSVFAVMFGGWVATVNASFDSVPGDILYPVKLATERVQITLAGTSERRAKLHAEFASRRLQEVVEINNSDRDGKEVLVQAAVDGFKQELNSANEQLVALQTSSPETVVDVAVTLEQKSEEYQAVLSQTDTAQSTETISEALVAAEEINTQAIESLLTTQETAQQTDQQTTSSEHLKQNFQEQYLDIRLRIALNLGRIEVVKTALANAGITDASYQDQIKEAQDDLQGHDDEFRNAMDFLAAGGYRRAFEILNEVEAAVKSSEEIITGLEITISTTPPAPETQVQAPAPSPEEPAAPPTDGTAS